MHDYNTKNLLKLIVVVKTGNHTLTDFLGNKIILFVVFITGACVLIIEVVATRILSPFFGNTIYSISSIIGVVLAALSFGYYFGGKYADKHPKNEHFYVIILISGISVLLMKILIVYFIPLITYKMSLTTGPLFTSLILFLIPSFLLGTLSPFAITLQRKKFPRSGIGNLTGEIFFFSTMGSIAGSFISGFYLIPNFGSGKIILFIGILLCLIGFAGSLNKKIFSLKNIFTVIAILLLIFAAFEDEITGKDIIFSKEGLYEKIYVIENVYKVKKIRLLVQGKSFSSGAYKAYPDELAFEYTKYIDLYKLTETVPKKVLFLGGGAYSMPNYLVNNLPDVEVDVTEVEPDLYDISKKFFGVKDNQRIKNHIEDGRRFLKNTDEKYDIIFSDVYSSMYSIPTHFTTKEFFELGKSRLSENGIFIANIIGNLSLNERSLLKSEFKTFGSVFTNHYYFLPEQADYEGNQNVIFLGLNSTEIPDFEGVAKAYKDHEILANLKTKLIDERILLLSNHLIMTDDYAPAEYLTAGLFNK